MTHRSHVSARAAMELSAHAAFDALDRLRQAAASRDASIADLDHARDAFDRVAREMQHAFTRMVPKPGSEQRKSS